MIIHYKEPIQNMSFYLKTPLQFSKDFTFVPIQFKHNEECIFQTPRLYVPYGRQSVEGKKDYLMMSFQNKTNDLQTDKFLKDLQYIYDLIWFEYSDTHNVNSFIKNYNDQPCMNIKLRDGMPVYDTLKQTKDDIPLYSYASFIIHLVGIWVSKDQVWFQWYSLQARVENDISLQTYAFKDTIIPKTIPPPPPPPPPPPNFKKDKYKKMISLGIPSQAVNHQKQIDLKSNISSSMLQSVQLKKSTHKKEPIKSDMNGFEPPSLDSLQQALQKLRSIIHRK